MAGQEYCAEMEAASSSCKEGPVLTMINKRLRAFKKKLNKINQIEGSKAQGKQINKEQEEVLKSKAALCILVDEYEKLRAPLMVAVKEEIEKEVMEMRIRNEASSTGNEEEHLHEHIMEEEMSGLRIVDAEGSTEHDEKPVDENDGEALCNVSPEEHINVEPEVTDRPTMDTCGLVAMPSEHDVIDLLHLLYFAQLFDVPRADASPSLVWTRVHERSSCVSYDLVTEEDISSPLAENDLNDLALLGSLITSRPPNATLSHRDALQQCAHHALLWICNSDTPITDGLAVTYSQLKERLHRILSSDYYTMTPELQTFGQQAVAAAASAAGQYSSQMFIHAALSGSEPSLFYTNQQRAPETLVQSGEQYMPALPMRNIISEMPGSCMVINAAAAHTPESNIMKDMDQTEVEANIDGSTIHQEQEQQQQHQQQDLQPHSAMESLQSAGGSDIQEQQQDYEVPTVSADSRGYQGPNGSAASGSNDGRSRSHPSGRGGHGTGRGGYGNGRGAQLHDQRGYYPRNQYGRGGGRSRRASGSSSSNGYTNGQARASGGAPT